MSVLRKGKKVVRTIRHHAMAVTDSQIAPERLIVHAGHHKVATVWFQRIFKGMHARFGWERYSGEQENLPPSANIFHQHHSRIDFDRLPPYIGSHVIRDPRDVVISGYFYHLTCREPWCIAPRQIYGQKSYQEMLQGLNQDDGLEFEIRRCARQTYRDMMRWNYNNENIKEVKYEDLIANEIGEFRAIFSHYGLTRKQIEESLEIVKSASFESVTKRPLGQIKGGAHMRSGKIGQWRDCFTERHVVLCKELYGEGLKNLGYESDDSWR